MTFLKKSLLSLGVVALAGAAVPASADGFSFGFGYHRGPRYYRAYVPPVRTYVYDPVVVYRPPPVVYYDRPVVVRPYPRVVRSYSYYSSYPRVYRPYYRSYYSSQRPYYYYGGGRHIHGHVQFRH